MNNVLTLYQHIDTKIFFRKINPHPRLIEFHRKEKKKTVGIIDKYLISTDFQCE